MSSWEKQAQDETIAALKANAKKNMEAVKADKDDIQKVRICLNQITMDNYDSKKDQLRKVLFGDRQTYFEIEASLIGTQKEEKRAELALFGIDEEKESIVVKTIFRKAAAEPIYVSFYATLCSDIVRLELEMKGYEPKKSNVKHCSFRTQLLSFCRDNFTEIFDMGNKIAEMTDDEEKFKHKEKLYGNIDFIGALYKSFLLPENVVFQVLISLLSMEENSVKKAAPTDDMLEAALKFILKVGKVLQERITSKNETNVEKQAAIFERFRSMEKDDCGFPISQRFQLLIRNMLDDRSKGW